MAIAETYSATLAASGVSDFVPLGANGGVVTFDFVDSDGNSVAFGAATIDLLYSPDGKMQGTLELPAGTAISNKTDGLSVVLKDPGYVAISVASYASNTAKLVVTPRD